MRSCAAGLLASAGNEEPPSSAPAPQAVAVDASVPGVQFPRPACNGSRAPWPATRAPLTGTQPPLNRTRLPLPATPCPWPATLHPLTATPCSWPCSRRPLLATRCPLPCTEFPLKATEVPLNSTERPGRLQNQRKSPKPASQGAKRGFWGGFYGQSMAAPLGRWCLPLRSGG